MSDEATAALVQRAKAGSARAFEQLVRRYLRAVYSVALAVLRVPAEAEDIAQEALVLAWEKLSTCREPERFGGWVLNIARNLARNALAHRDVKHAYASAAGAEAEPGAAAAVDAFDARDQLLRALDRIDERQREVVLLHDLEGWSHAEIAVALELSEVNSRQLLFTARKQLRQTLHPDPASEVSHGR